MAICYSDFGNLRWDQSPLYDTLKTDPGTSVVETHPYNLHHMDSQECIECPCLTQASKLVIDMGHLLNMPAANIYLRNIYTFLVHKKLLICFHDQFSHGYFHCKFSSHVKYSFIHGNIKFETGNGTRKRDVLEIQPCSCNGSQQQQQINKTPITHFRGFV